MNDIQTAPAPTIPTAPIVAEELTAPPYIYINYDAPPLVVAAITAFKAEYFDLLAHAKAHPEQRRWWAAYYGSQRIGLSSDHLALDLACAAQFPDGQFRVYYIDPIFQYPTETEC